MMSNEESRQKVANDLSSEEMVAEADLTAVETGDASSDDALEVSSAAPPDMQAARFF